MNPTNDRPTDVPPEKPFIQRIRRDFVYKVLDAMHACGIGDHPLPPRFFHRHAMDQRRYFTIVHELAYCTTCRLPKLHEEMRTVSSCHACAISRDQSWNDTRERKYQAMLKQGTLSMWQKRTKRRRDDEDMRAKFLQPYQEQLAAKMRDPANLPHATSKPEPTTQNATADVLNIAFGNRLTNDTDEDKM